MKNKKNILTATTIVLAGVITAFVIFSTPSNTNLEAQGVGLQYGGKFTQITNFCCDGTIVLQFESVTPGFPEGKFQTSWSMNAYSTLFYFPLPQSCAIGFVRPGGVCVTIGSSCESTTHVDYTITDIGTSPVGCGFVE